MSRRLDEMTEQSFQEGGQSDRKNIQEAGFSEELKAKLEDRIAAASFKSDHAAAFSIANMPVRIELRMFLRLAFEFFHIHSKMPGQVSF